MDISRLGMKRSIVADGVEFDRVKYTLKLWREELGAQLHTKKRAKMVITFS